MKLYKLLLSILILLTLSGCDTSDAQLASNQGRLSVLLTDAPADYRAVFVTINDVLIHATASSENNSSNGWIKVAQVNETIDLLSLQNGLTKALGESNVSIGTYNQVRMTIGSKESNASHPYPNYVVLNNGNIGRLKVPSNTIKSNHSFKITHEGNVTMIIDFDADKSVHQAGRSGKWILKPVLNIITRSDVNTSA